MIPQTLSNQEMVLSSHLSNFLWGVFCQRKLTTCSVFANDKCMQRGAESAAQFICGCMSNIINTGQLFKYTVRSTQL